VRRSLVTGAAGQLGSEIVEALEALGHGVTACDRVALDVADRDRVLQVVAAVCPDTVVHAAAWTDVDGCEGDTDRAWRVNALGTRHVAEAARLVSARVCYVSSDYVFDGTSGRPYTEWDDPRPASVYGRSKLAGERVLGPGDTVVRTSWLCGRRGRNFVRTMVGLGARGEPFDVVDDQHGCPTFADDLAGAIAQLVSARLPGTFHVTNSGATTWFALARDTLALAGMDPALVRPVSTADLRPARPAPRPAYSVLDNAALRLSGLPLLPDHHEPLERLVKEL
jgi:dTDP-4-dehydrorhamnose reductase